jgi:hypothetical protein
VKSIGRTESIQDETITSVSVAFAGRLEIGKDGSGRIASSLINKEDVDRYVKKIKDHLVIADETNCAVCMDGRGCHCLASDVSIENGTLKMPHYRQPPIRLEMAGGLFDMAAMMALLSEWSGLREGTTDFLDARSQVAAFLEAKGYKDGAHTADTCFDSSDTTECGAWMKKQSGMKNAVDQIKQSRSSNKRAVNALDQAVGAYNGLSASQLVAGFDLDELSVMSKPQEKVHEAYLAIRQNQSTLVECGAFDSFDPVALRDEFKDRSPKELEVLFSDNGHPTHNHKEPALVIIDTQATYLTLDRDALYQADGFAPFVDNRNFRRHLSKIMAKTDDEAIRLLIAGDVATVDVSNELVAPGMPVILVA